jgi:hypothetical protein
MPVTSTGSMGSSVCTTSTEHVIKDNRNKNTCTKTKSDLKMFYQWFLSNGEMRMIEDIPFPELDGLLARLYLGIMSFESPCFDALYICSLTKILTKSTL